eukprot:EG_transcript_44442
MANKKEQQAALKNVGSAGREDDEAVGTGADGTRVQAAFGVSNMEDVEELEKKKLDKALAQVKVSKEDVKLVADELEIDARAAERALKQNNGDLIATLRVLIEA